MTRDTRKIEIRQGLTCYDEMDDDLIVLIDEIYDDFESRTCKNCKHSRDTASYKGALDCTKGYATEIIDCGSDWLVDENFGCNEFERKQND